MENLEERTEELREVVESAWKGRLLSYEDLQAVCFDAYHLGSKHTRDIAVETLVEVIEELAAKKAKDG